MKSGISKRTAVASELRNLLYGIQGELFDLARDSQGERMSWEIMSDRLVKSGVESTEHVVIKQEGLIYDELVGVLSTIAKDREGGNPRNLDDVCTKMLDHIHAVLSLIKPRSQG